MREKAISLAVSKNQIKLVVLGWIFIILFVVSFSIGRFYVPVKEVIHILIDQITPITERWSEQMEIVVVNVRLPRIVAAALVGMALSAAGVVYQGLFKNPMVSPDILGASAGAGFGAALGIFLGMQGAAITTLAFLFGILAVGMALLAAIRYRYNPTLGLVLAGIMIGSLFSAATSFIKLVADPTNELPAITYWLMGSLANIRVKDLYLLGPCVVGGMIPLLLLRWRLNVLTQGEEAARSLGVNVKLLRMVVISCATLMSAACVSVSGMIGWVGLVIPHFARKVVGCDYKYLLPATILMGGSFMIIVDNVARTLASSEVPIGILTAFIGAPFFWYMILKGGKA